MAHPHRSVTLRNVLLLAVYLLPTACFYTVPDLSYFQPVTPVPEPEPMASPLSDEAWFTECLGGLAQVLTGHPDSLELTGFLHGRGRRARTTDQGLIASEMGFQGTHFWIVVEPLLPAADPRPRFDETEDVLHLTKVVMAPSLAGLLLAGELARTRAHLIEVPGAVTDEAGVLFGEMAVRDLQGEIVRRRDIRATPPDAYNRVPPPATWGQAEQDRLLSALEVLSGLDRLHRWQLLYDLQCYAGDRLDPDVHPDLVDTVPRLAGVPALARRGRSFDSPIAATVVRRERPQQSALAWTGLVLDGAGPDRGLTIRLLGLEPTVTEGDSVVRGQIIGTVLPIPPGISGPPTQVHIEVYRQGCRLTWDETRRDPILQRVTLAYTDREVRSPIQKPLEEARRAAQEGDYETAVAAFRAALASSDWQVSNTPLLHCLARCLAAQGRFEEAAAVQRELLGWLVLEQAYAAGQLPDPRLGVIGACPSAESLQLQIARHRSNLAAYERVEDTRFFYAY